MQSKHFAVAIIGLLAIACAYFLGRVQTSRPLVGPRSTIVAKAPDANAAEIASQNKRKSPTAGRPAPQLPPPDAPVREVFAELQARANAGDVAAATRLYRDLSLCGRFRGMEWASSRIDDEILSEKIEGMDPAQLENYQLQLDAVEGRKQAVQRIRHLCEGASDVMLDSLVPNLQKAAMLGEEYARSCYLKRGPNYDMRSFTNHPELLEAYKNSASSLVESGIAAGDWKVVDLLREAYQPGSESLLSGLLGSDSLQYYRYLKLYRLGAEDYRVEGIDRQLAAAARNLTPAEIADADSWAQMTLQTNFNGRNSTESTIPGWDPCSFPYE